LALLQPAAAARRAIFIGGGAGGVAFFVGVGGVRSMKLAYPTFILALASQSGLEDCKDGVKRLHNSEPSTLD